MKKQLLSLAACAFLALPLTAVPTVQAQNRAYRATDVQVQTLLNRLETRTDSFKQALDTALNRSNSVNRDDSIFEYVTEFENATDSLKQRFDARGSVSADVEAVLGRANYIQDFMQRNRLTVAAQNQWRNVYFDLNTLARYYSVTWNRSVGAYPSTGFPMNPNNPGSNGGSYTVSDREIQNLLNNITVKTNNYRTAVQRGRQNNASINSSISDFETATSNLRRRFDARSSSAADVQEVLNRAAAIDSYMRSRASGPAAVNQWNLVRNDLNTLATYYNVSWNWNNSNPIGLPNAGVGLSGTYSLNIGASDNVTSVVERAISNNNYAVNQRERVRQNLERRLTPPAQIAVENINRQFTVASSNSPQATLTADGSVRTETTANGRTIRVRAESIGNNVNISYEGDRVNDFYVTFEPLGANQMRVTRRVYLENQNEQVTVTSIYDRTSSTAQFDAINNNNNAGNSSGTVGSSTNFYVPNGTKLTAVLTSALSTKNSVDGERFTMEVSSPSLYQGAIIEGRVSRADRSGRVSGRAELSLDFEQIRLRNGQSYRFSGLIDGVRNANGDTVNINNEGVARDGNQTTKTITRAGIGAALGAIIGAIAGGGSGAAIGAGVGAGAGAGSVILQGRDDLELNTGTEFSLTSSAPANLGTNR